MQDARLRLFAIVILSAAAFSSMTGAVAAFIWWAIFTPGIRTIAKSPFALFFLAFTAYCLMHFPWSKVSSLSETAAS